MVFIAVCFTLVIGSVLVALKGGVGSSSPEDAIAKYGSDTLKVYNWGEYLDPEVNAAFEKKFGVKIVYDTFDSNELMYTKLQSGESYDVLVPSDYMIERLIQEETAAAFR